MHPKCNPSLIIPLQSDLLAPFKDGLFHRPAAARTSGGSPARKRSSAKSQAEEPEEWTSISEQLTGSLTPRRDGGASTSLTTFCSSCKPVVW
ncbi:hypothetical protein CPB84DRAFT_1764854 [Gymnopilus junonius]|uniref:Uncharacterized protein n=1 Tax=Gymnopilus junonius TaxID=109634 RepID=A0A9P5TTT6_GYMJU|nr:hypothetical protein CPB84DRAFT_1764854 [Gymnopilus junonius]